jgi:hypothetical protein
MESIKEAQRQFEIANEPLLTVDSVILTFQLNKPIIFKVKIRNIGKYPAKVLAANFGRVSKVNVPDVKEATKSFQMPDKRGGDYIGADKFQNYTLDDSPRILDQGTYNSLKGKKTFLYLIMAINYRNMSNNRKKIYYLLARYTDGPSGSAEILINDNQ